MIGEEKSLCAEITALQKRIESWKMQNYSHHHVIPPTKVPAPLVEEETDQHDLPPEINSFEVSHVTEIYFFRCVIVLSLKQHCSLLVYILFLIGLGLVLNWVSWFLFCC